MSDSQPQKIPHQLTAHTKLLHKVALIAVDSGTPKVLILRRSPRASSRPGKWDLPGGNSEWPDKVEQPVLGLHQHDVAREIREETGLEVVAELFDIDSLVYFMTHFAPSKRVYSINCGWTAIVNQSSLPIVELSDEHTDFAWIALEDLDQYDFGPADRDYETMIIRRVLENK